MQTPIRHLLTPHTYTHTLNRHFEKAAKVKSHSWEFAHVTFPA